MEIKKYNVKEYLNSNRDYYTPSDLKWLLLSNKHLDHYVSNAIKTEVDVPVNILNILNSKLDGSFNDLYVIGEKFDRRTKQGKLDAEAFDLLHNGKAHIIVEQDIATNLMLEQLKKSTISQQYSLFENGSWLETYLFELDNELKIKYRPSKYIKSNNVIIDIDVVEDVREHAISNYIRYKSIGVDKLLSNKLALVDTDYYLIAIESKPPYTVAVYNCNFNENDLSKFNTKIFEYVKNFESPEINKSLSDLRIYNLEY